MRLTPNTALSRLKSYAGLGDRENVRTSRKRRRYLEMIAAVHKPDINLEITGSRAYCNLKSDGGTLIVVPAEEMPQPVTELEGKLWDLLCQKTQTYHELGHHLYTDWPSFEACLNEVRPYYQPTFKTMWNLLEDAAIERMLTYRFNIKKDLRIKNENIFRNGLDDESNVELDVAGSVLLAVGEFKHPTGHLAKLLDKTDDDFRFVSYDVEEVFVEEVLPELLDRSEKIKLEDDPEHRNRQIYELWDEVVQPAIEDTVEEVELPEGLDILFGQLVEPDHDMSEAMALPPSPSDDDEESDEEDMAEIMAQVVAPEEYDPESSIDEDEVEELAEELESDMSKSTEDEPEMSEELDSYRDSLRELQRELDERHGANAPDMEMVLPGGYEQDAEDWGDLNLRTEARAESLRLTRLLYQQLNEDRRNGLLTGQRSGKLDHNRMHQTERGDTRIFTRIDKPDEKDYRCVILLDRSGSMSDPGRYMNPVVKAVGALAFALEEVGIDVMVMSLTGNEPRLEKPFSQETETTGVNLFNTQTAGGTPLTPCLGIARRELEKGGGNPFIVVITDGEVDSPDSYKEEIDRCQFPVVGVSVGKGPNPPGYYDGQAGYFHAITYVDQNRTLQGIEQMINRIMF